MTNNLLLAGMALLAVCALTLVALLMRAMPRATFVLWAFVLFFVPVWVGVTVGLFWAAIAIVTLLAIVACGGSVRLVVADGFMAAFVILIATMLALGMVTLTTAVTAVLEWGVPYVWGRLVLVRISSRFLTTTIAVFAVVAASLALVEFATGTNIFISIPGFGPVYDVWGHLQYRSGLLRVEGAWGHSIAFGAALAMSSAFVLAAPWRTPVRLFALSLIGVATVVTFSRIGLVSLVLTIALSIVTLPQIGRSTRIAVAFVGLIAAAVAVPLLSAVFLEAGTEAGGSADYRTDLYVLVSQVQLFGSPADWAGLTVNGHYLGTYAASIDNALLLIALRVGWVPTILLVSVLVIIAVSVFVPGRSSPASIAVTAQIPSLFAVALITQYATFLWFAAGLAIAWHTVGPASATGARALTAEQPTLAVSAGARA